MSAQVEGLYLSHESFLLGPTLVEVACIFLKVDLLQLSQFVRDVLDVFQVLPVDGLHVLESAPVDDVVLRLQFLHLVRDLQLQR